MDLQKEREAFLKWHYQAYLLENPEIDMQNAQYIYDYAHKNALCAQLRESHFTVWQAAKVESHKQAALYQSEINHLAQANQQWREKAAKAQAVPEGFVLVPKEPTSKMIDAADNCAIAGRVTANIVYKAMIEAAQEQTRQMWSMWQAAKDQAIPDGFVVVPKEPTQELLNKMQDFFVGAFENGLTGGQSIHCAYIAMIEAQEQANESE